MAIDMVLAIGSFALSVGGLVPVFIVRDDRRKRTTVTVVLSLLIILTGITLQRENQHARAVYKVQREIIGQLSERPATFDQLYQELFFVPFPILTEALFAGVEEGSIQQRPSEVVNGDGSILLIRLYYRRPILTASTDSPPN